MATFTYRPDRPVKIETIDSTLIQSIGKYEQRRLMTSGLQKMFNFSFSLRLTTEADAIEAFYVARDGAVESFTWVDPITSSSYTLRFVPNSFRREYIGRSGTGHLWSITFQCMEVN